MEQMNNVMSKDVLLDSFLLLLDVFPEAVFVVRRLAILMTLI